MGKQGTKIVGIDVKELINELNKAYADEWLAYYSYWYMSKVMASGCKCINDLLEKIAKEELEHADELADRILELGGSPIAHPMELEKNANAPYPKPPADLSCCGDVVKVVLDAEAGAIDVYNKLAEKTMGKDHVTYQLICHILAEEVKHEELFESIKGPGKHSK